MGNGSPNAIRQHRVLEVKMAEAKTLANHSKFNVIEDNGSEIGIIGSGVGYYYARSVLDTKKFSWLKLGFVSSFSRRKSSGDSLSKSKKSSLSKS